MSQSAPDHNVLQRMQLSTATAGRTGIDVVCVDAGRISAMQAVSNHGIGCAADASRALVAHGGALATHQRVQRVKRRRQSKRRPSTLGDERRDFFRCGCTLDIKP